MGGVVIGQYSTGGPAHRHEPAPAGGAALASRGSGAAARAHAPTGTLVPLSSVVTPSRWPSSRRSTTPTASARSPSRATSRRGTRRARRSPTSQSLNSDAARRLPHRHRAAELAVQRRDERASSSRSSSASSSRTWCSRRSSTRSSPGDGAHDLAAVGRRRHVRAARSPGRTLNVFSMIGLLLLMGIVKKNSIILVDYANEVRAARGARREGRDAQGRAGAPAAHPDDGRRDDDGGRAVGARASGPARRRAGRWPTPSSEG